MISESDLTTYMSKCELPWYETTDENTPKAMLGGALLLVISLLEFCCCQIRRRCNAGGKNEGEKQGEKERYEADISDN